MNLSIEKVSKRYGNGKWGLRDLSLNISSGVLGLLGSNGAGKSTLMRIIATVSKATSGVVRWNGADISKNPDALRTVLGYLPQNFGVYQNLNAIEFLKYIAALKGIRGPAANQRIDELIQIVNLTEVCKRPLGGYSGGMNQRVGIAQALLNDPELLIIDEPTVGLDPEERVRFRNLLSDLSGDRIVIFSTHIVSDIEATATHIAVLSQGQLLTHTSPEALINTVKGKVWECMVSSDEINDIRQKWLISGAIRHSDGVQIRVVSDSKPTSDSQAVTPALEDAYLYCKRCGDAA
ncbi:MAG TPA: ABC transporter ATP-binding protein [Bacillota bacterium]|nr:ABC transporter ATP-binding protein [Bacillota bacterium]